LKFSPASNFMRSNIRVRRAHNSSRPLVLDEVKDFVTGICCFDMGKVHSQCSLPMKCYCLE